MCQALEDMCAESEAIGEAKGITIGEDKGIRLTIQVMQLQKEGLTADEIARKCEEPEEKVQSILLMMPK